MGVERGEVLIWKRVWGCADLKSPFSHLSCHSQAPSWGASPFTRPSFEKNVIFWLQNQTFLENTLIFSSRSKNLAAICVKELKNCVKIPVYEPLLLMKICLWTPTFTVICLLTSPKFRNMAAHTYQKKGECLPPPKLSEEYKSGHYSKASLGVRLIICYWDKTSKYRFISARS